MHVTQDLARAKLFGAAVDHNRLSFLQRGVDRLNPSSLLGVAGDRAGVPCNVQDGFKEWR